MGIEEDPGKEIGGRRNENAMMDVQSYKARQDMEHGSSMVECRTRNQVSPGLNPSFATISNIGHFRSLH